MPADPVPRARCRSPWRGSRRSRRGRFSATPMSMSRTGFEGPVNRIAVGGSDAIRVCASASPDGHALGSARTAAATRSPAAHHVPAHDARLGGEPTRPGSVPSGSARSGSARSGSAPLGSARSGSARSGSAARVARRSATCVTTPCGSAGVAVSVSAATKSPGRRSRALTGRDSVGRPITTTRSGGFASRNAGSVSRSGPWGSTPASS